MKKGWAILILALLASCSTTVDLQSIVDNNPGKSVTVNKVTGEEANLLLAGLEEFCPGAEGDELYRVQITGDNKTVQKVLDNRGKLLCEVDTSDPLYAQKSVAVLVNDEPIYLAEVQAAIRNLPQGQRTQAAATVVNDLVNQKLLLQKAEEKGLTVSDSELDQAVSQAVEQSSLSLSQLTQGDANALREGVRQRLKIQKAIQQAIQTTPSSIRDAQARQYYEDNMENLTVPVTWTLRQIQINKGDRTDEQTRDKAETVKDLLNTTGFCSLVTQFSDDQSSLDKCGRYTFASGQMIPAVEAQVKEMSEGQVSIVESPNSYHIIELLAENEPRQATFSEAKEQIKNFLLLQERQKALNDYLEQLRNESEIISYLG